ncbi:homoserine dehydrogenase [Ramlibacter sp. WS9]|uniref:homoserine dehydrogenase n=1 Tax=Ramlibacter sp. WS9 TaxID=1882741 RepID=UPI001141FFCE|nr:homoserine dehydrogenase [Ramlibacter sp. WS9]ROZ77112.1 homoserine dehydrogenase [Ramlibacter sp. WS9]
MQLPSPHRNALRVGLLGFGVVGSGTHSVLTGNRATIAARAGRAIELAMIATRTPARAREAVSPEIEVLADARDLVQHPAVDVVVEAIGGTTAAREHVLAAIAHGKHVVTANKALLALHGDEIFGAARERGVSVHFEGAVAVSIPIVKALREGLAANEIEWLAGIVNGTSNYVLTEMRDRGRSYEEALADAQALGYAEADPALDVDGGDAAHKLALLAAIAFGGGPRLGDIHVEGVRHVQAADFKHAARLGYTIKLLAVARRSSRGLQLYVHPALIPSNALLAHVDGRMNAILVNGNASGVTMHYGAGAGSRETASAVVADLVDLARARDSGFPPCVPPLGFHEQTGAQRIAPMASLRLRHYLRISLATPSAAPEILRALAIHDIEVEKYTASASEAVLLTRPTEEGRMAAAVSALADLPSVRGVPARLRVEDLVA